MARPSDMIVYDNSMRPSASSSPIRKWADVLTLGHATGLLREGEKAVGVSHMAALMHTIRANGEGGVAGAIMAAISATGGLDRMGYPVDFASALGADLLGIGMARSEFGATFRQMGSSFMTVFTFRKTEEWLGVRKKVSFAGDDWNDPDVINTTAEVDIGADPIVQAAQAL